MAADTPDFVDPAEDCPWHSPREIFARYGYAPLPPSELDDRQLPGRLWEWLYAAAALQSRLAFAKGAVLIHCSVKASRNRRNQWHTEAA